MTNVMSLLRYIDLYIRSAGTTIPPRTAKVKAYITVLKLYFFVVHIISHCWQSIRIPRGNYELSPFDSVGKIVDLNPSTDLSNHIPSEHIKSNRRDTVMTYT